MDKHMNIICHNCLSSNFPGIRYICCECDNFNLCQACKEKSNIMHNKEHAFVQITKPVRNDIKDYKNLFRPNKIFMSSGREPFEITYEINNIGNKNLKGCYFLSIKTSKKYLKCKKEVIKEDIRTGEKKRMHLTIAFNNNDDDEDDNQDVYEGYFRLFTEEGVPFGDILYLQDVIED